MRTIRLAWPPETPADQAEEVFLSRDQARHGALVLRLAPGAAVEMTGPFGLAPAQVTTVDFAGHGAKKKPRLGVRLTGPWSGRETVAGPRLALALIQGQRFDWAVEKATELGAAVLIPLVTERTKTADGRPGPAKQGRWRRLAEEARKQCGRPSLMEIAPVTDLAVLLAEPGPAGIFLSPGGPPEPPALSPASSPLLVIGPEGGLSPTEEESLLAAGFQPWSLGLTILRSETAALAALARLTASFS